MPNRELLTYELLAYIAVIIIGLALIYTGFKYAAPLVCKYETARLYTAECTISEWINN